MGGLTYRGHYRQGLPPCLGDWLPQHREGHQAGIATLSLDLDWCPSVVTKRFTAS
jgi:hypothetical protein